MVSGMSSALCHWIKNLSTDVARRRSGIPAISVGSPGSEDDDEDKPEAKAFKHILTRLKEDLAQKESDDRWLEAQMPRSETEVPGSEAEGESEDLMSETEAVPELQRADSRLSGKLSFMPNSQAQVNRAYRVYQCRPLRLPPLRLLRSRLLPLR